jgi:hypothetical protein
MESINYYKDNFNGFIKGYVTINGENYVSELTINDNGIKIRLLEFETKSTQSSPEIISLRSVVFQRGVDYYLLFRLELDETSFMTIGAEEVFRDHVFSAQGFIYSQTQLNQEELFTSISVYGDGITKWSGNTRKLNKIMEGALSNKHPLTEDCLEFQKNITSVGIISLSYSYRYGGLEGLHTVGINVKPRITITFEEPVTFNGLIDHYIDLYMILRFFIGNPLMISDVKIQSISSYRRDHAQLYIAEKKEDKKNLNNGLLLPYSSFYRDDSEDDFSISVWENYYNPDNREVKELIKKYVTYTMVKNNEEKFLGFYRIIEAMTLKKSCYFDEEQLSNLLKRAQRLLAKYFPNTSLSDFVRAIKTSNKSKSNTERCIHNFIKSLSDTLVEKLKLKEIKINEICASRNKIIHQPLFSETPGKIYKHMQNIELLIKLAMLIRLGVTTKKIEDSINYYP